MCAENHVLVGELMEAKANVGDHGGAYASPGNGNFAWLNDADISGATGGYSLGFALTVIQVFPSEHICITFHRAVDKLNMVVHA